MSSMIPISRSVLVCAAVAGLVACDGSRSTAPKVMPDAPRLAVDNERNLPFAFAVPTCDELVNITGFFHVVFRSTTSASGNTSDGIHLNAEGIGVGATTGARYLWNDVINITQNIHGDGESGVISNPQTTELIGQGGVSDIRFRSRFHLTFNANGDLTAEIDQFDAICK